MNIIMMVTTYWIFKICQAICQTLFLSSHLILKTTIWIGCYFCFISEKTKGQRRYRIVQGHTAGKFGSWGSNPDVWRQSSWPRGCASSLAKAPGFTAQEAAVLFSLERQVHLCQLDVEHDSVERTQALEPNQPKVPTPSCTFHTGCEVGKISNLSNLGYFSVNNGNNTYLVGLLFCLNACKTL